MTEIFQSAKRARPYAGEEPDKRRVSRRKKLIAAGFNSFGTIGVKNTKIDTLCREAKVGIRSLYEEFGTTNALFVAVYQDIIQNTMATIESALNNIVDPSPQNLLHKGISCYLHQMLDDPRCGRIISIESAHLDQFPGLERHEVLKSFSKISAARIQRVHSLSNERAAIWSLMLSGAINELVVNAVASDELIDIEKTAQIASEFWSKSLVAR